MAPPPSPWILHHYRSSLRSKTPSSICAETTDPKLSRREQEVATLIARGHSNQQIADELVIGRGTPANHVGRILANLGCRTRTEVAVRLPAPPAADEEVRHLTA
jgi:DNA-binding NarL/FixJ family response regulator